MRPPDTSARRTRVARFATIRGRWSLTFASWPRVQYQLSQFFYALFQLGQVPVDEESEVLLNAIQFRRAHGGLHSPVARPEALQRLSHPFGALRVCVGTGRPADETLDAGPEEQLEEREYKYRVAEAGYNLRDHLPEDSLRPEQPGGCEDRHAEDGQGRYAGAGDEFRKTGAVCVSIGHAASLGIRTNPDQPSGKPATETAPI